MKLRHTALALAATTTVLLTSCGSGNAATQTVTATSTTTSTATETVTTTVTAEPDTTTSSSSSSASASTSSAPSAFTGGNAVGQPATVEFRDGTGAVTINEYRWATTSDIFTPKNGAFLSVDVTYEATEGTVSYNAFDWQAKDADAREYSADIAVVTPGLQSGDLPAGEKVRGWITFDVPQGVTTLAIDDIIDGNLARWEIPAA